MTTNTLKALLKVKEFIAAPGVFDMVSAKLALSSASPADAPGNGPVNTATREMKMANPDLRLKLQNKTFITAPGVFDLVSAKLVDGTQAEAIYMGGFAVVASHLGLPDAGIADYSQMLDRAGAISDAVKKPVIADGDTGYGGLLNVHHTVRGYEKADVTMIQLEDQRIPKKCGHEPRRHIVSTEEMVNKIKVASDARSSKDFLILARTDWGLIPPRERAAGDDLSLVEDARVAQHGADRGLWPTSEEVPEILHRRRTLCININFCTRSL
jgi:2-methylisocitrate lyase-like PEP mutase family enzyme